MLGVKTQKVGNRLDITLRRNNGPAMRESGAKPKVKAHSSIKGQGTSPG